jgi:uncharacterized protein YjaG (DUF416 family)
MMTSQKLNTLDDYEMYLGETIERWSPEQRLALAASQAERWLTAYDVFSKQEDWGDAPALHNCLNAVWGHLLGEPSLSGSDRSRYIKAIHDVTPHMDDFDAIEALVACTILDDAVECCKMGNNSRHAIQALISGFEAVNPDWSLDPDELTHLWQTGPVRKELRKQLKLLEQVGSITKYDQAVVNALRSGMIRPDMAGEPLPREESSPDANLLSNQAAFEQYRRMIEADIRGKDPGGADFKPEAIIFNAMLFAEWSGRYRRRQSTICGEYGKMADKLGLEALMALQRGYDAQVPGIPDWDKELLWMLDLVYKNPMNGLDVNSLEQPHGYGPSMRRLWIEAKRAGSSDDNVYMAIVAWGRHRPEAWREADERKKKGRIEDATLAACKCRKLNWTRTENLATPWETCVDGVNWKVRINDFPDDYFYTLLIDGATAGNFNDWPETWLRE